MAIVVSDTSPLRALGHVGQLPVLAALYDSVLVPPSVVSELLRGTTVQPINAAQIAGVTIRIPSNQDQVRELGRSLGPGESEALALAVEFGIQAVMIDELRGRAAAVRLGLQPIGALGVLVQAKSRGLIGPIKPMIARLRTEIAFAVSDAVVERALRMANET